MRVWAPFYLALPVVAVVAIACSSDVTAAVAVDPSAALETYAANLYAAYGDSVKDEEAFSTKLEAFLAAPTEASLTTVRSEWLASRAHYMLTEGARFYGGPIDADPANPEQALNSWPLDEAYIDYTTNKGTMVVDETAGIINKPALAATINPDVLDKLNAQGGDTNVSNGYHAIEFLLWGQALRDVGPGQRPATDYVAGGARKNVDRRVAYIRAATAGVSKHLTGVRDAWAPGAAYRTQFTKGGTASLALALTGLGKMSKGELGGQRMDTPYASKDRRDQHDCFSSLTLVDYERDAQGMLDMYIGKYGAADGPGFDDLVRTKNADLDARIKKQMQASIDAIHAIPAPFEQAIVGDDMARGRVAVHAAVVSLRAQADLLAEAGTALGLTITIPEHND